jgi:Trehalose utilisation
MKTCWFALALLVGAATQSARAEVLIVADEFPAMQVLAGRLDRETHLASKLVSQKELPASLATFEAVVVYIHGALAEPAEDAFINYTKAGGKLVLLHHSISSGKRKNHHWFSFLGVALPEGELAQGGYKWIEGVRLSLVNLNPRHFIMTNEVSYPELIPYASTNAPASSTTPRQDILRAQAVLPGFTLEGTEVYLNHVHTEPRTLLMGLKYEDSKSGTTFVQDRAGWLKPAGRGLVIYLMPGHTKKDFEDATYGRIVVNAVLYKP